MAACCSFDGKVMLQYYTPQEGAAACILQLASSLAMAKDVQIGVDEQVWSVLGPALGLLLVAPAQHLEAET
jgi:hypothetical protein